MQPENDFQLENKIKITFEGMPYWVMPRYVHHYIHNEYEKFSLRLLRNMLPENGTFLDVGTHYGAYSLFAAKKCNSKVISVEPVDENFELLSLNIKENNLTKNVETHNVAASDEEGTAEFNIPWASDSAGFYEHPLAETIKKVQVTVKKIDNVVKGRKIDFIKIDTEGHEVHVLKGMQETFRNNPDVALLIEANPSCLLSAGTSTSELLHYLQDELDKELYVVNEDKFTLFRLTGRIEKWADYIDGYANILCVPKASHQFGLFACHSSEYGGAELALVEHVEALQKRNILAHVTIPAGGDVKDLLVEKGISHSVVNYSFWSRQAGDGLSEEVAAAEINSEGAAQIMDLAKNIDPTFMANNSIVCPWAQPAAKALGLPLVWFVHEYGDLDHSIDFSHDLTNVRAFVVDQSDLVICCSQAVKDALLQGSKSTKTHVVYPDVSLELVSKMSKEKAPQIFSSSKKVIKLAFVGRIKASKGQMYAVQALRLLVDQNAPAELALIGPVDEEYKKLITKEIKKLNLTKHVKFIGFQKNPHAYTAQADAVIVASNNEAFGRTTVEAMMLGKVVIGSNAGGTAELIKSGVNGILFKPKDSEDLAKAILKLRDKKNIKTISSAAEKSIAQLLNPKNNSAKLYDLIAGLDYDEDRSYEALMVKDWTEAVVQEVEDKKFLKQTIAEHIAVRGELEDRKIELEARLIELENENRTLNEFKQEMLMSTSWKISRPVRVTGRVIHKTKHTTASSLQNLKMHQVNKGDLRRYTDLEKAFLNIQRTDGVKLAVVLHLYYTDLWSVVGKKLDYLKTLEDFDLFVTLPVENEAFTKTIKKDYPSAHIFFVPNRGRDVLPFIKVAEGLAALNYEFVLKLHSKKSPHRSDGSEWFSGILEGLIPEQTSLVNEIVKTLSKKDTGLIGPTEQYISLVVNYDANKAKLLKIVSGVDQVNSKVLDSSLDKYGFFAGTMFWARLDAIAEVIRETSAIDQYETEKGQIDGTFAHANERAFSVIPELKKRKMFEIGEGLTSRDYATDNIPDWSEVYIGPKE